MKLRTLAETITMGIPIAIVGASVLAEFKTLSQGRIFEALCVVPPVTLVALLAWLSEFIKENTGDIE